MKFNNYLEAIEFVLIKCSLMNIDAAGYKKGIDHHQKYSVIRKNNIINTPWSDIDYIILNIRENFNTKYIIFLNDILKEHFNIHIERISINTKDKEPTKEDINILYDNNIEYTLV